MEQFRAVRRKDREWDTQQARTLLEAGEYGFLAMSTPQGYGYGIPISYALDGRERLYFHGASQGMKLDAIHSNPRVSFCVVGDTQVIPRQFTTAYESVHLFGRAFVVTDPQERLHALRLLVRKYSPDYEQIAEKYIAASFARTAVIRFEVEHLSAKAKRVPLNEQQQLRKIE